MCEIVDVMVKQHPYLDLQTTHKSVLGAWRARRKMVKWETIHTHIIDRWKVEMLHSAISQDLKISRRSCTRSRSGMKPPTR